MKVAATVDAGRYGNAVPNCRCAREATRRVEGRPERVEVLLDRTPLDPIPPIAGGVLMAAVHGARVMYDGEGRRNTAVVPSTLP